MAFFSYIWKVYRYGFNGKEKDDELKGQGNSYDFGARIYDPRIGRWFKMDNQFYKQSGWSPYKAFNDNPILFVDPDGNTEYSITTIVDHKNKKTTVVIEVLNEDKLDRKIVYTDYYNKRYFTEFRDIIHSNTIEIYEDGTTKTKSSTEYSIRYTRGKGWEGIPEIPDWDFSGNSEVNAEDGLVLSSKWGKSGIARGNKTGIKDAKEVDITALEVLTTVIRGGDLPKGFEAVNSVVENTSEIIQQYFDANGLAGDVNLKEGKIEIKYEPEKQYKITYRQATNSVVRYPNNAPMPISVDKDTVVNEHDIEKVRDAKEKKYQKDYKRIQNEHSKKRNP